jgi:hypothetical protein
VQAAQARSVELVAPIPGRELEKDPVALTLDDFAMDERYARRSDIESTNSGLKNRLELKRLCHRALENQPLMGASIPATPCG